ncbi:SpaH/EbpB family LPXTG-anchored major pilin [Macrococcus equipercicus]|uniref:SpaH/EbpB family LPXTG-anchored major pilin n=1 Tax=Macrococcus equipercicus TaxID=69967 RepID=A0A9Q9BVY1_9STAP|nr:SpaH/EbpB family LPXTG-anchored major pilin [Macrococcus equipercicus]UTH14222.1 SpaH/EbpB family LPXTG-anchored major pilin [Macrococcus equipercicus]
MSKLFKRLSLFLVLALLVSIVAPLGKAFAASPATNLTIHKVTGSSEIRATYDQLVNGTAPAGSQPISNISFTYWKVTPEQLATMKAAPGSFDTESEVTGLAGAKLGTTAKTSANGTTTAPNLAEGFYWFIEDVSTAVKTSNAVPFGLELPITNEAGNGYITDLHVFPKNTLQDLPTIDKDVKADGTKSASFAVGESFNWIIQPSVPKGINEYTKFTVTDTIASQLTFAGTDKVYVEVNGTKLAADNYTVSNPDGKVVIDFTDAGRQALAAAGDSAKLNIFIPTVINDTAVMGLPIQNNATLTFDNGHGTTTEPGGQNPPVTPPTVPSTDTPIVYTGGKKFVKTNGSGTNLEGAVFVVKNAAGKYLVQDAKLNTTWVDSKDAATKFTSKKDGSFEVKGLSYGTDGSNNKGATDYTIEEVTAPAGYTLPTNPETSFTVNATSYYADPTAAQLTSAAPKEIVNKKTEIPNTGGIGTVIFTVVGLALMLLAFVLLRRRQQA